MSQSGSRLSLRGGSQTRERRAWRSRQPLVHRLRLPCPTTPPAPETPPPATVPDTTSRTWDTASGYPACHRFSFPGHRLRLPCLSVTPAPGSGPGLSPVSLLVEEARMVTRFTVGQCCGREAVAGTGPYIPYLGSGQVYHGILGPDFPILGTSRHDCTPGPMSAESGVYRNNTLGSGRVL